MLPKSLQPKSGPIDPKDAKPTEGQGPLIVQVDFEVFGETQGTYFLRYAKDAADRLGLRGWVKLSHRSTVMGQIQGEKDRIDEMALWLRLQGAPGSRIERTDFINWQIIESYDFKNFKMRF